MHTETLGHLVDRLATVYMHWHLLDTDGSSAARVHVQVALHQLGELSTAFDDLVTDLLQLRIEDGDVGLGSRAGDGRLERLGRVRELLTAQDRRGTADARLACCSGAGFTDELHRAERDGKVVLVDLDRLYTGS